ncbi:mucin-associated surface protein (MASP) [Trypanosoma cruzi Dm28c]|uniref:Mucin-associated surface protein (MASP) n=2 Tax=Trypanosoma cruzi TaxID=5693 RepID=V5BF63_TRYCR|nr:mucin-associated surface protein (MASP) [Trypanosoma cruzi Dm28c]PBJ79612.1 mucin-associated surface protein [Trypanosoma cruzi cruzi]PWV03339.1 Mucin-associated surface protein (MASP) [Trypanosoma cruzi]
MAMMMTGRVLLVCALCVLWCGAGCGFAKEKAVQDVQTDVSGDDERHKKETGKEENKSQPEKREGGNNAEVPPPPPPVATQPGQAPTSQEPPSAQLTNETIKPEDPAGKDITRVQTITPKRPEVEEEAEPAGKTPEEEKKGTKEKEVDQKEQKGKDEKEHEQPQEQQQQQQQFERGKELPPLASPLGGEATQRSLSTVKSQELQQEHLTAGATEHLEKGVPSVSTQSASNGKTNSPTQSATPIAAVTAVTTEADKEKAKSRNDTESPEAAVTKRGEKHEKPTENDKTLATDTKAVGRNDTGTHDDTDSSTAATTTVGTDNGTEETPPTNHPSQPSTEGAKKPETTSDGEATSTNKYDTVSQNAESKTPPTTNATTGDTAKKDNSDSSTAVSHTTSPLLLLVVVVVAAAAAVVAA